MTKKAKAGIVILSVTLALSTALCGCSLKRLASTSGKEKEAVQVAVLNDRQKKILTSIAGLLM